MISLRPTLVLTLLPAMLLTAPGRAQEPSSIPQKSNLSVDAKLVVLPAVVRDKKGVLVKGLTRDNFGLQVDGKAQALRYFDHDTDVPLTLGLLIDTSLSQRNVLDEERTASAAFLERMLVAQRDKAFVIEFARTVELLQDVTDSRGKLQAALKEVDSEKPQFGRGGGGSGGGGRDPNDDSQRGNDPQQDRRDRMRQILSQAGTALYDGVFLASEDVLMKQPRGRRALVLLTDGEDHGSKESLAKAIESAQRADAIVYAIYYKGQGFGGGGRGLGGGGGPFGGGMGGRRGGGGGYPGGGRGGGGREQQVDGKKVLERMCGETGGRMFEVTKKETVEKIYGQIGEELRSQYRIGFTPTADAGSEGYHQVTVTVSGQAVKDKTVVQTRDGYYTGGR